MSTTPGKAFYDRQVAYLEANDVDGLIANQYADDAIIVSFDFQHKGTEALRQHFINYLAHLGSIKLLSTDKFTETPDSIYFEATVKVAAGVARVYDVFMLKNGKATHHYTGTLGFTPNPS
jgi:ketosteroid isomerase-like protein